MNNVKCIQSSMSPSSFWQSINILLTKFNVVNKRLWSSKVLKRYHCKPLDEKWYASLESIIKIRNEDIDSFLSSIIKHFNFKLHSEHESSIEIIVIELLPKKYTDEKAYQLVCLDKDKILATFYDITPKSKIHNLCPSFAYSLSLNNQQVTLRTSLECCSKSQQWLQNTVLPQFVKWGNAELTHDQQVCTQSLGLISSDKYYNKYNDLKQKYGKGMVEIWPEVTDPSKYVYEDVAIATYLLLLWEDETDVPQKKTFVDLGCGNGLLVYILTKEGHKGIGIDVRKRNIWDMYPKDIVLEEKTIIPSDSHLFPEADWLIGNHSDELTPWIPVIATRSSYKCNFFLLPCCAYNFDGTKYQRRDSSKSQYMEYLEYVKMICDSCGYETSIDRLKIPSTKRICLVGQKKTYSELNHPEVCNKIQFFIDTDYDDTSSFHDKDKSWSSDFKPRDTVEKVRNCTQIDQTVIFTVINSISRHLLKDYDFQAGWSVGKEVNISELVTLLSKDSLKAMKAECGGLQTLLRNNHHIFKVQKGKVQLRYPRTIEEVLKNCKKDSSITKVQFKPCWFHMNHPQGCPLTDKTCSYLHLKSNK